MYLLYNVCNCKHFTYCEVLCLKITYLDNSATTAVCQAAAEKASYMMTVCYGNPSSLHRLGFEAERELEAAKQAVADLIGAPIRVVVSPRNLKENKLEISTRDKSLSEMVDVAEGLSYILDLKQTLFQRIADGVR